MKSAETTVNGYIKSLPEERRDAIERLRKLFLNYLPKGFEEGMEYGMITYSVPHQIYPKGYHCNPKIPLPFLSIASQKNFIAVYHMGLYADLQLMEWFKKEYDLISKVKIDMGKSCIRFKKTATIPYDLLGALAAKMSVTDWVNLYEKKYVSK